MSPSIRPEMLLVTEDWIGRELASRIGPGRCARCEDPYDALRHVAHRPWSSVVLTRPQEDLPGLCKAIRRLRPEVPIYAWCSREVEAQLKPLLGQEVQETFLYPPTPAQIQLCVRSASRPQRVAPQDPAPEPTPAVADPAPEAAPQGITPAELMELIRSARSLERLEGALAELVAWRLGEPVSWRQALEDKAAELLHIEQPAPRSLVAESGRPAEGPEAAAFLASVSLCLSGLMALAGQQESLRHLAITDELTGLYNPRYFYVRTDRILRRMAQQGRQATLVLFDVDNFKHYNDTYGHAVGDEILRETALMMRQTLREHDVVARIGGDEFAMLLWEAEPPRQPDSQPMQTAMALVRRFREAIRHHTFAALGDEAKGSLTMSGGAAVFPTDGEGCRELLGSADRALRRAKQAGKDTIQLIGDDLHD